MAKETFWNKLYALATLDFETLFSREADDVFQHNMEEMDRYLGMMEHYSTESLADREMVAGWVQKYIVKELPNDLAYVKSSCDPEQISALENKITELRGGFSRFSPNRGLKLVP
jgi:hypothetical protein